jgi:hypothetical protein
VTTDAAALLASAGAACRPGLLDVWHSPRLRLGRRARRRRGYGIGSSSDEGSPIIIFQVGSSVISRFRFILHRSAGHARAAGLGLALSLSARSCIVESVAGHATHACGVGCVVLRGPYWLLAIIHHFRARQTKATCKEAVVSGVGY